MKKINEAFVCVGCQRDITPAHQTCRNHCPYCFSSLHVDGELPGDRATACHGKMLPFEYQIANGQIKIHFICLQCGKKHRNKVADDDLVVDLDGIIQSYKIIIEKAEGYSSR